MRSARQTKILFTNAFQRWPALLLVFCVASLCGPAQTQVRPSGSAQPIPAADSRLIEIKVTGSKRFTQEEIAAATGLLRGATVDDTVFRKAARQLGETGAFNDISYSFSYSSAGTRLAFQVTDADKFVPARFTDFVWFSDRELIQKVHERIPLFSGELPTTGRLPDQVSDILQATLVENNIPGNVQYQRTAGPKGELASIDYNVANVTIRIHEVKFTGAEGPELAVLEPAARKLSGRDYSRTLLNSFIEHALLATYRERGYLKAACAAIQPKVVKAGASGDDRGESDRHAVTLVDVTLAVTPGIQYKLKGWDWSGNKNVKTDELQALLHAKPGQPANALQLEDDLHTVQQLYGSRGYVTATIKVDAHYDDADGTVAYQLAVTEGYLYRMGELAFRGIDNNLTARLRAAWKIRPGDVYDVTYLKDFLPQARKLLPATIDWEVTPHVTAIARDKTVDVDLQYTAKAPQ
jgi:outer membrane protein assembly factor BamA